MEGSEFCGRNWGAGPSFDSFSDSLRLDELLTDGCRLSSVRL